MSFFDGFSEGVASVAKDLGGKAKELSGAAKIHASIKGEEVKMQELYYKLGKKYYEKFKDIPDPEVADVIEKINLCNEKICQYKDELEEAKDNQNGAV